MTYNQGSAEGWDLGPSLLESVWRYRRTVIVVTLAAGLVGFGGSFLQQKLYEGQARVVLTDPRNSEQFGQIVIDPSRHVRNQAEIMTSAAVLARAAELEGGRISLLEVDGRVTATPSSNIDLIVVSALDPTPAGAASLANSVVAAYEQIVIEGVQADALASISTLDEQAARTRAKVDALDTTIAANPDDSSARAQRDALIVELANYTSRADQIQVDAALYGSGVNIFESAEVPGSPAQPSPIRNTALAMVLGAMTAAAWAWWRADRRDDAEHRNDPAAVLGAPLLAEVPDFAEAKITGQWPAATDPKSAVAESYNFLASAIGLALPGGDTKVILITSMGPGDGKSVTAANLAFAADQPDRTVLLVDADERARGLSQLFKTNEMSGLTDLAASDDTATKPYETRLTFHSQDLRFVPAGSPAGDTAAFFRSPAFRSAIRRLRDSADLVIIDSPPMLVVADTAAIASQVDGIVVVVAHGASLRGLADLRQQLQFLGTPLLGYVYNRSPVTNGRYGYAQYGYGQYGYGEQR